MPSRVNKSWAEGFRPDIVMDYATWADNYFYLPRESTSEYGKFRMSRTPFIREILEALSPEDPAEVVTLVKPTQQAGTTTALIFICGMIDMHPGPCMMMMPTDNLIKSFSKKKLTPAIDATPRLQGKIAPVKSRGSSNTIKQKEFQGGSWMGSGSNSGASYRSESIKYFIFDDFDGCPAEIVGEGDTLTLADRRTGTFAGRKVFLNSTTTVKGVSNIENAFEQSSQGYYHTPCPICGVFQYWRWGGKDTDYGIKFTRDKDGGVEKIWYQCENCQGHILENQKTQLLLQSKYVHKYPDRIKTPGFRYNALCSPIGWINSWRYIAEEYLKAVHELRQGDPRKYVAWLNTLMSEPYEEKGDQPEWTHLKMRCEPYQPRAMLIPDKVKIITSGTDVQGNRLAVSIYGWGPGEECWLIYHIEIIGDPMHSDVWEQHDQLIYRDWEHVNGTNLKICSAGIDCGDGNTTQAVRNYCRYRAPVIFALRGSNQKNRPIIAPPSKQDVTWQGEKIENGIEVWPVGVDTAKATLYARLKLKEFGPGYVHFPLGTSDEFFQQLTAEKLITRFVKGYPIREWHNVRGNKRNEALDTWNYAYSAAIRAGLPYLNFDRPIKKTKPKQAPSSQKKSNWFGK